MEKPDLEQFGRDLPKDFHLTQMEIYLQVQMLNIRQIKIMLKQLNSKWFSKTFNYLMMEFTITF